MSYGVFADARARVRTLHDRGTCWRVWAAQPGMRVWCAAARRLLGGRHYSYASIFDDAHTLLWRLEEQRSTDRRAVWLAEHLLRSVK